MIGNEIFGYVFDTPIVTSLDALSFVYGKYHKLVLTTDTTETMVNSNNEIVVTPNTILATNFNRTLDVGSLRLSGGNIEYIVIEKKIENKWVIVAKLKVDKNKNEYKITDNNVSFGSKYEYRMYPLLRNIKGSITKIEPIEVYYGGMFLSDKDNNFSLIANSNVTINHNTHSKTYDLLSSNYPIISYNDGNYATMNVKALCLSSSAILDGQFTVQSETDFKKRLFAFLNNKKPKIYRDNRGVHKIVNVVDVINFDEIQNLKGAFDISLSLIEVADVTDSDFLLNNGLIQNESTGDSDYE